MCNLISVLHDQRRQRLAITHEPRIAVAFFAEPPTAGPAASSLTSFYDYRILAVTLPSPTSVSPKKLSKTRPTPSAAPWNTWHRKLSTERGIGIHCCMRCLPSYLCVPTYIYLHIYTLTMYLYIIAAKPGADIGLVFFNI